MEERRKYKRVPKKTIVFVVYRKDGEILFEESAAGEDLSEGGIKISLPINAPRGEEMDVKVYMFSDPIPILTRGKIVWSKKAELFDSYEISRSDEIKQTAYLAGIQFLNIDAFTRERILQWIKQELRDTA